MKVLPLLLALLFATPVAAHDFWNTGVPVPPSVKAACCGVADGHMLEPTQAHELSNGDWRIDGYANTIPKAKVHPSPDEKVWFFNSSVGAQSAPYCLFVPCYAEKGPDEDYPGFLGSCS